MKVALLTAAIAAALTLPARAAQLTADFSVKITEGDFLVGQTFLGQLTYDDSSLTRSGTELLDPSSGLISLIFNYVGQDLTSPATYTEADDVIDQGFPVATFTNGQFSGLDYAAEISPGISFQFLETPFGSGQFSFLTDNFNTFATNTGAVTFGPSQPPSESVPEPALTLGLALAIAFATHRKFAA